MWSGPANAMFVLVVGSSLWTSILAATNGISDIQSAYDMPTTWDTVDKLYLKTFVTPETGNIEFNEMYNNPPGQPKKKMGVCIQSVDYPNNLTTSCGTINVRGQSSRESDMKGMKVKLDKTVKKWRGRRKIILIKSPWDNARIRNAVAYSLLSTIDGFIGIGVAYVHLFVDENDYGLYHVVEDLDDNYLVNHGLGKDDFLLKADYFEWSPRSNPDADWVDVKNPDDSVAWHNEIMNISTAMENAEEDGDCNAAEELIKRYIDVDSLTTFIAINTIMLDYDVLDRNFLLYRPATGGKWSHLFWDKDDSLDYQRQETEIAEYTKHPPQETYRYGIMFEMAMSSNKLYINFLRVKGNFEMVKRRVMELTSSTGPMSGEKFAAAINKYASRVRPYVGYGIADSLELDMFDREVARLLNVYDDPSAIFAEFEETYWGNNTQSTPFCDSWLWPSPTPTSSASPSSVPSLSPVSSPVSTPSSTPSSTPKESSNPDRIADDDDDDNSSSSVYKSYSLALSLALSILSLYPR
eukprot:CFRG7261T1